MNIHWLERKQDSLVETSVIETYLDFEESSQHSNRRIKAEICYIAWSLCLSSIEVSCASTKTDEDVSGDGMERPSSVSLSTQKKVI